jgi:hypothetical protein
MNATTETEPNTQTTPGSAGIPADGPSPDAPVPAPKPEFLNTGPPRNGKIAQLPVELRDLVNQMLAEGATSAVIIEKLAEHGVSLNHQNVSNWRHGGYQDWVARQEWLADIDSERESAAALLAKGDETSFHQAVLQLALTQIFQTLRREQLKSDPSNYTRLLNALSRIAREALVTKRYRDDAERHKAAQLKRLDPEREFNEKEHDIFLKGVERLFGFRPDQPIGPPLAEVLAKIAAAQSAQAPSGLTTPAYGVQFAKPDENA